MKRKSGDERCRPAQGGGGKWTIRKHSGSSNQKNRKNRKRRGEEKKVKKGPRLPNALRKELEILNPSNGDGSDNEEVVVNSDDANEFYEYEGAVPEEVSKKNRRYDPVEDLRYKFSADKDDDIGSDEGDLEEDNDDDADGFGGEDDIEEEDEGRHARMLEGITGLPRDAFEDKKRKRDVVITEAYPESEYNPIRSDGHLSIQDLLDPLHERPGFSKLRKSMERMEKKSKVTPAPLPNVDREKVERTVANEFLKNDITKWEPLVKKNREAPTIYFNEDIHVGLSTVGAIASEFEPRTDFEKKIASLVNNSELLEAHRKDGARLLELNKISVEDVKERKDHHARLGNLLFRHEMKAKRVKKIKSKAYRRSLMEDRLKATATEIEMDPEAAKELAMKQEFRRAEERLTLKHKNKSKWAKRILERGLAVQDDGTRAAIAEQLQQHAFLTRKMKSMKDGSSSDESSEEDDDSYAGSDEDNAQKLLEKAKKKITKVLGEEDEIPKSGLFSLPFMAREMKKRKEAADEEAKLALQEFESSLKQLEDKDEDDSPNTRHSSGRRVFGAPPKKQHQELSKQIKTAKFYGNSDSEDDSEAREDVDVIHGKMNYEQKDLNIDPSSLRQASEIGHDPLFKSFEDIAKDPGSKTAYEVAIFASNSWEKKKNLPKDVEKIRSAKEAKAENTLRATQSDDGGQDVVEEGDDEGSDSDSEGNMVDGILSAGTKYELPSQADLIRRAFAGDDVEDEFEKEKQDILNKENPEPEKQVVMPGWGGQWSDNQKKRGLPPGRLAEEARHKKMREKDVNKRKDAHLTHVIISEKIDKKAEEKFQVSKVPYPYTSKKVFDDNSRMPIGPEFNPSTVVGPLNRGEVVKKSGLIIKPIEFRDIDPHERKADDKQGGQKPKNKSSGKATKKKNIRRKAKKNK